MRRRWVVACALVALLAIRSGDDGIAQEATPDAAGGVAVEILVVQSFAAGRLEPVTDEAGVALLTLERPAGVVYFSDRPNRIVGTTTLAAFLDVLAGEADDPPNAALVITPAADEAPVIYVVELLSGQIDEAGAVRYRVRLLADANQLDLDLVAAPTAGLTGPISFGANHLFIDGLSCTPIDPRC